MSRLLSSRLSSIVGFAIVTAALFTAVAVRAGSVVAPEQAGAAQTDIVLRGRTLVITHACGECHGGGNNPDATDFEFHINRLDIAGRVRRQGFVLPTDAGL